MAYTAATSITEVRALINESTADFWSDTEITNWIQQGTLDLSSKLLCVKDKDSITLVTNQVSYNSGDEAWIADCLKIDHAYYVPAANEKVGMGRMELHRIGHTEEMTGAPKYFYDWFAEEATGGVINIWPRPTTSENAKTVDCIYSKRSSDITVLPDQYQHIVFLFAAAKAKLKDRLFQESALLMAEYLNSINFERKDKQKLGTDPNTDFVRL